MGCSNYRGFCPTLSKYNGICFTVIFILFIVIRQNSMTLLSNIQSIQKKYLQLPTQ